MEFGFPKSKRILKTKEFRFVFDSGVKNVSRHLVMFGVPSQSDRVGLVVSKKVGNAVVRNKVKRMLREHFRQALPGSAVPMDIVVIARHTAKNATSDEISASFGKGISKLRKALEEKSEGIKEKAKEIAVKAILKK